MWPDKSKNCTLQSETLKLFQTTCIPSLYFLSYIPSPFHFLISRHLLRTPGLVPQGVRHFLLSCQKFCPTKWSIGHLPFIGVERTEGAVNLSIPLSISLVIRICRCWFFWLFGSIRLDVFYFFYLDNFCPGLT